jgi:hypothetical protein
MVCSLQQLTAQLTPGYRGKRFVAEAGITGGMHNLLNFSHSFAGRLEYTVARRSNLSVIYDYTTSVNNIITDGYSSTIRDINYYATVNIKELGLEYAWGRLNYTLSPYGRFWYIGASTLSYSGKTQNRVIPVTSGVIKGYGVKVGAFERTIVNRFVYSYGYELAAKSGRNNLDRNADPRVQNNWLTTEISNLTGLDYQLRVFFRVGLAF